MKTKRQFISPQVKVAEADLEGLVCTSGFKALNVDELQNMNLEKNGVKHDGPGTEHYFEF